MDNLSDEEITQIWTRVKKYINPEKIKSNTLAGVLAELEAEMQAADASVRGKQGNLGNLIRGGFAENAAEIVGEDLDLLEEKEPKERKSERRLINVLIQEVGEYFEKPELLELAESKKAQPKPLRRMAQLVSGVRLTKKKILFKPTRGKARPRQFSQKSITAKLGLFNGKPVAYFYHKGKKRIVARRNITGGD